MLAALPVAAGVIPVDLPPPDARPPVKDKPVKVYILSGQSNMAGFGAIEKSSPLYAKISLSADPSVEPGALPVANAALLRHGVYQSAAPSGHLSVWLESAKLPPVALAMAAKTQP
jgi:hypothetical protein